MLEAQGSSIFSGLLIGYNDDYNDPYRLVRSPYVKQGTKTQVVFVCVGSLVELR